MNDYRSSPSESQARGCRPFWSGAISGWTAARARRAAIAFWTTVAVAIGGCTKVGDSCDSPADWECLDPGSDTIGNHLTIPGVSQTAAVCRDGKWMRVACSGGCRTTRVSKNVLHFDCAYRDVHENDPCIGSGYFNCSADGKADLLCKNGTFVMDRRCKGPKGCAGAGGGRDNCDDSIADVGDSCWVESGAKFACSTDKKRKLECSGGKFTLFSACAGPKGCDVASGFECDVSLGAIGDACHEQRGEANYACTPDKKELVTCKDGKFALSRACKGPKGCWLDDGQLAHCDDSRH